ALVLVGLARTAEIGMVDILLAAARIAARRLQMAVPVAADPHLGPGRRDHQRAQAVQSGAVAQSPASLIAVDEALSRASPREAGIGVADIGEAGMVRGVPAGRNCLDGGSFAFGRRPLHPPKPLRQRAFPTKKRLSGSFAREPG